MAHGHITSRRNYIQSFLSYPKTLIVLSFKCIENRSGHMSDQPDNSSPAHVYNFLICYLDVLLNLRTPSYSIVSRRNAQSNLCCMNVFGLNGLQTKN